MRNYFKGKNVLVYGMGISGQEACKLLHKNGACVSIYDDDKRFCNSFNYESNPIEKKYDAVVVSPGIKLIGNQLISHFILRKTLILSELDLGYLYSRGNIIAITGTNGKTTVTSLVGHILKVAGKKCFICGNIGLPISSIVEKSSRDSIIVCEVSNFQLEASRKFSSNIACILNLAPDHIDRHNSFEEYLRVKKKIITNKFKQKVILNFDDNLVNSIKNSRKTIYFSKKTLIKGVFIKNNCIYYNHIKIISLNDIPLFGEKNIENILASIAIVMQYKIKPSIIRKAILSYKLPSHRLEFLGEYNKALIFDDSKATNISASLSGIESLGEKGLVILMGGLNKDCLFDEIFNKNYAYEEVLCFGESGEEVFNCAKKYGYNPKLFKTMKECALYAKKNAREGQKILLSPACASFDEFASYAVRGEVFKEIMFGSIEKIEIS